MLVPSGQDVAMLDTGRLFADPVRFGTDRGWSLPLAISQDRLLAISLLDVVDELSVTHIVTFYVTESIEV